MRYAAILAALFLAGCANIRVAESVDLGDGYTMTRLRPMTQAEVERTTTIACISTIVLGACFIESRKQ